MKSSPVGPLMPLLAVLPQDGRGPQARPGEAASPASLLPAEDPLIEIAARPAIISEDGVDAARLGNQAAMRVDQLTLGRMAWQPPDAAVLAQAMAELARQRGRVGDEAAHALASAILHGTAVVRDAGAPLAVIRPDPHFLPVYLWGGAPLLMALAVAEDAQSPWRRKRQRAASLRLELTPPLLGRLVLELHWVVGGLELTIAMEQAETVPQLRAALPAVSNALRRVGLTLLRFNLLQGAVAMARLRNGAAGSFPAHAQWQSLLQLPGETQGLFRALAETAVVLMGWAPGKR